MARFFTRNEKGQAMVEFVIVFPVLFLLFLLIIQTALLLTARHLVNYAAFCAVRSAIVYAPEIGQDAVEKARKAAVIACIPIAPKTLGGIEEIFENSINNIAAATQDYPELLRFDLHRIPELNFMDGDAYVLDELIKKVSEISGVEDVAGRVVTSNLLTSVSLLGPEGNTLVYPLSSPNIDITAEVTHFYTLRIPIINKIFYESYLRLLLPRRLRREMGEDVSGDAIKSLIDAIASSTSSFTIPIVARCTLTSEGRVGG